MRPRATATGVNRQLSALNVRKPLITGLELNPGGQAGLTLAAYLVQAGMDVAEHRAAPVGAVQREMLGDLFRLIREVNRVRTHLSQAVARVNSDGAPGPDLERAAGYCMRVVQRVDEAAQLVQRRLA